MEKLFYADAKDMVKDFKEAFPWIDDSRADQSHRAYGQR